MEFNDRLSGGKAGQDILINFLESHFGYKFEAGERNNSVINVELIEELEHCEFIPEKKFGLGKHGSRLRFTDGERTYDLTMPDVFMSRNSKSGFYWIEAKTHFDATETRLIIDQKNFDDYALLYTKFTRQSFLVMCLHPDGANYHDVYFCEFQELLDNVPRKDRLNGNTVYIWGMKSVMKKLNRYPIDINKYG